MKLTLLSQSKDLAPEKIEFELATGSNLIGRWDPDSKSFPEIDLEDFDKDALVSRRHAQITVGPEGVFLEDLGSKNGTFLLGGLQLEAGVRTTLAAGAEFLVGNIRLKLEE